MTDISMWSLLAVVEVEQKDRIQCQCEGCGRIVYKAIHIVIETARDTVECWGSDCYERITGRRNKKSDAKPEFGNTQGRRLTDQEREWLKTNRALLIEKFREEARAEQEERQRLAEERALKARQANEVIFAAALQQQTEPKPSAVDEARQHEQFKKEKMGRWRSEQANRQTLSPPHPLMKDPEFQSIFENLRSEWRSDGIDTDSPLHSKTLLENALYKYSRRKGGK